MSKRSSRAGGRNSAGNGQSSAAVSTPAPKEASTAQDSSPPPQSQAVPPPEPRTFPYPGMPITCDGAEAVVHVEINVAQGAGAFPITSSTTMGGGFNAAVMNGRKNLWGDNLIFVEPESEHSAATFCEGFAAAGGRVTNFTSGQGLVLMKEVLYTISGKRLPAVFNIGARALTSHSLNVHAGHDDLMSVADCGWGMLFGRNAQEAGDLCLICRRTAEASHTPFFNVQHGFLTTHTVEKVLLPELEFMKDFVGKPEDKILNMFDPENPVMVGVVQNQDSYMKGKIAQRWYYDRVGPALRESFQLFYEQTGRRYDFVTPYLCDDAEFIIVGMGCYMETTQATVDYLRKSRGLKVGCLNVCCFRPFPAVQIVEALKSCKAFSVLERMDDPLSTTGNHLTREIKAAFCDAVHGQGGHEKIPQIPRIYHGSAGLGSRDVRPGDIIAVVENMAEDGQEYFCIGIDHALALRVTEDPDLREPGTFSMRGHSVGGFGSVTTNKVIATIAGDVFGKDVQAYPKYGSEKKGLPTTYYLSIAKNHIQLHSELEHVDLVVLNDTTALFSGNPLKGLVPGGAIIMQSSYANPIDVWNRIPQHHQRTIRENRLHVYYADIVQVARDVASVADLQMRMQGIVLLGAFLKLTPYGHESDMTEEQIHAGVEKALRKYFGKRGERVVQDNLTCVKRGYSEIAEVPQAIMHPQQQLQAK